VRALASLRGRVALLATLAVAVVLLLVGATAVASFADRERSRVDDALAGRPIGPLVRALGPGPPGGGPPDVPEALRPEGEYVRAMSGSTVVAELGTPPGLPKPSAAGLRTLHAHGHPYRSLTRQAPDGNLLEVGTDLKPAEDRIASLRNRVVLLGGIGVALVAGLSWWLAGVALGPLRSLRDAAGRVSSTRDLSNRLSAEGAPEEVGELAGSVNAMLARLESSAAETDAALEATRRFAGDAGHELRTPMTALRANLGALRRNPDLDPAERRRLLEDAEREADRAARLLEVLQTLARGDAGAALPTETIDLAGVAESAIEAARSRHPENDWRLDAPPEDLQISGWPDGLRALIDNLLENAARHGRPGGQVQANLARANGALVLTVDDDGPGVEAADRDRIFERFARGNGAATAGYGLGLALVRQQARLHGGEATVGQSPLGGARFEVRLAASP
jgi:two-component system sensor histidine kinase PrrB